MFCNSCGNEISEGDTFCPNCGSAVGQVSGNTDSVEYTGAGNEYVAQPQLGLKWAHFLAYFGLWAGALMNLYTAIRYLLGNQYGDQSIVVYAIYNNLRALDIFYGICLIVLVVLGCITAVSIIKLKRQSGTFVCLTYLLGALISTIYLICFAMITDVDVAYIASIFSSIFISVVMIFVNRVYFNNRKHIFVN